MSGHEAMYHRDGDAFVGTGATKGSWYDSAQAGGAVLALLGHVLEDVPTITPMTLTRLTVDIVRPVPIGEHLWIEPTVVREGKRIQLVDVVVRTAEQVTTRARALRSVDNDIRPLGGIPHSSTAVNPSARLLSPEQHTGVEDLPNVADFLVHGAELRQSPAPIDGMHSVWVRLRVPVVAGEEVRPTSRATVILDMVNLLGTNPGEPHQVGIINPDVSGHLTRGPVGEWVAMTGNSYYQHDTGHGLSTALISDEAGVFGVTSTSQLLGR